MITCEECGKITGSGLEGTSWICDDCKEAPKDNAVKKLANSSDPIRKADLKGEGK